jgi:hypothetical protein
MPDGERPNILVIWGDDIGIQHRARIILIWDRQDATSVVSVRPAISTPSLASSSNGC